MPAAVRPLLLLAVVQQAACAGAEGAGRRGTYCVSAGTRAPVGDCASCLEAGCFWQPKVAACASECMVQDISCYGTTDTWSSPCPAASWHQIKIDRKWDTDMDIPRPMDALADLVAEPASDREDRWQVPNPVPALARGQLSTNNDLIPLAGNRHGLRKLLQAERPPVANLVVGVIGGMTSMTEMLLSVDPVADFVEQFAPVAEVAGLAADAAAIGTDIVDAYAPVEDALQRGRLDTRVGVNFNTGATWQRNQGNDGILPGR